jgi:hypothetical protein
VRENRTLRLTWRELKRDHGCRTAVQSESDGITTDAYRARACSRPYLRGGSGSNAVPLPDSRCAEITYPRRSRKSSRSWSRYIIEAECFHGSYSPFDPILKETHGPFGRTTAET